MPTPDEFYTDAQRALQKEGGHDKLSNVVVHAIVRDELEEIHADYINSRDYFFLSTVTAAGEPTVSYKGGDVGFCKVMSPSRLMFPNYDGNGMWLSMGNIDAAAKVGMLFMDMVTPWRIRVQGTAKLSRDPEHLAMFPGANMAVDVQVDVVFQNCARLIHKHEDGALPAFDGGYGIGHVVPPHNTATAGFGEALAAAIHVAKASFSQRSFHHFIVTVLPNHMWASSCATTSAVRLRSSRLASVASRSRIESRKKTAPAFSIAPKAKFGSATRSSFA